MKVQTRILQAIFEWRRGKNLRVQNLVTDLVSLKVVNRNVAGLAEDSTNSLLSQISMLTDWHVLLLQENFRKLDGVNVGAHEVFTLCELLGGLRCPAVIMQVDCSRARWTDDYHFSPFALQRKESGRFRVGFDGNPEFMSGRPGQHLILGGDFNVSLHGLTDYHHVGESIPRPRTLLDPNDSLRARATHTVVAELDLTVTNTWIDADSEQDAPVGRTPRKR